MYLIAEPENERKKYGLPGSAGVPPACNRQPRAEARIIKRKQAFSLRFFSHAGGTPALPWPRHVCLNLEAELFQN